MPQHPPRCRKVGEDGEVTDVYTETGRRVIFACAAQWPGWCRKGRSEEAALAELAAYASRYAVVADRAGVAFDTSTAASQFAVVERVPGTATTDFGALDVSPELDKKPSTPDQRASLIDAGERDLGDIRGDRRRRAADVAQGTARRRARQGRHRRARPRDRSAARAHARPQGTAVPASRRRGRFRAARQDPRGDLGRRRRRARRNRPDISPQQVPASSPVRGPPHRLACTRPRVGDPGQTGTLSPDRETRRPIGAATVRGRGTRPAPGPAPAR